VRLQWQRPESGIDRLALYLAAPLLALLTVVLILFSFLYSTVRVEGDSMVPELQSGDRVLLRRSYEYPLRGDLVVFDRSTGVPVVKRVIGLPTDQVKMDSGHAFVNGAPERGTYSVLYSEDDISHGPYTVPAGSLYVAGDNRPQSLDSRDFGAVPQEDVLGEAILVYWPLSHFGRVDRAGVSD